MAASFFFSDFKIASFAFSSITFASASVASNFTRVSPRATILPSGARKIIFRLPHIVGAFIGTEFFALISPLSVIVTRKLSLFTV